VTIDVTACVTLWLILRCRLLLQMYRNFVVTSVVSPDVILSVLFNVLKYTMSLLLSALPAVVPLLYF
jgi:predicted secreted protein